MRAAAVMVLPVAARPLRTAVRVVAGLELLLLDAGDEEDLVVHGQPEQDGEHHHRQEGLDRPGLGSPGTPSRGQPHWNTATRMPKAAPIDSRFMTAAVSGMTRLRNTMARRRNENSDHQCR